MILLTTTSDKIQVVTTTTANVDVHASWVDLSGTTVTPGKTNTRITTATTTDVVAAPAASTTRNVKTIHVSNNHASASNTVSLQLNDGAALVLESVTLAAGERMGYVEGVGMRVFDTTGREKIQSVFPPAGNSSLAAQGPGFAADTYVTGSNWPIVNTRVQAGTFFNWVVSMSKTAAGTAAPTFNIRYGTAGAVGDTSRVLFTGPAQTAAADTAWLEIFAIFRATGASAVLQGELRLHHNLAVTGFASVNPAGVVFLSTTSGTFDSTVAASIIGLSMNGGASAAWTVTAVTLLVGNLLS